MNESSRPVMLEQPPQTREQSHQTWLQALSAESTLDELPSHDATVRPEVLTSVIDRELGLSPELPGVVIVDDGQLLGMISRPMLLSQLSRPFGQELYLKRPILLLLEAEHGEPLVLPGDLLVGDAAHAALQRAADRVYEPVVVHSEGRFRLLDVHTLLIAQSRLLALANETIRSQADVAEAANHAKSVFLANMSHEIRTPLTAILGFAENLLDFNISVDERTAAVETILRNGHHLLQLINDILDLSKIEADRLEIERLRFAPGELVTEVMSALHARAEAKQVSLILIYDGPIPDMIESDPTRLRQILMNLISNAIKFTPKGQVIVRVKMVDEQGILCSEIDRDQAVQLRFDVVDSGIGMSDEQLGRLFSPFMQADESMARRFGGTGLGLSISRRLAHLLGGDILVTSQANVGSTFTLQIDPGDLTDSKWHTSPSPVGTADGRSRVAVRPMDLQIQGRILLAEDGPDNQLLIGSFLRKYGADVTIVDNGRKAIDAALASLQERAPFQIVLMDMQMPVLDGYSATTELRARGWSRPILALTANAMQGDRQKCLDAGCNDFATKPINRVQLMEQIHTLMAGTTKMADSTRMAGSTRIDTRHVVDSLHEPMNAKDRPLDWGVALGQVGGDETLLFEIAQMLLRIGPEWLDEFQRHLDRNDLSSARRVVHSLRNSANNIGGQIASAALSRLEIAVSRGSLDEVASIWPECHQHFVRLLEAVEQNLATSQLGGRLQNDTRADCG